MTSLMGRGCIDVDGVIGASGGSEPQGLRGLLGLRLLVGD
jgi:hypothetical protein